MNALNRIIVFTLVGFLLGLLFGMREGTSTFAGNAGGVSEDDAWKPSHSKFHFSVSHDDLKDSRRILEVKDRYDEMVAALGQIVATPDSDPEDVIVRQRAAYLIGVLRAPGAAQALSNGLMSDPDIKRGFSSDMGPFEVAYLTAIIRIGKPALPAISKSLQSTSTRDKIHRNHLVGAMILIHGSRSKVRELLAIMFHETEDKELRELLARDIASLSKRSTGREVENDIECDQK